MVGGSPDGPIQISVASATIADLTVGMAITFSLLMSLAAIRKDRDDRRFSGRPVVDARTHHVLLLLGPGLVGLGGLARRIKKS